MTNYDAASSAARAATRRSAARRRHARSDSRALTIAVLTIIATGLALYDLLLLAVSG